MDQRWIDYRESLTYTATEDGGVKISDPEGHYWIVTPDTHLNRSIALGQIRNTFTSDHFQLQLSHRKH